MAFATAYMKPIIIVGLRKTISEANMTLHELFFALIALEVRVLFTNPFAPIYLFTSVKSSFRGQHHIAPHRFSSYHIVHLPMSHTLLVDTIVLIATHRKSSFYCAGALFIFNKHLPLAFSFDFAAPIFYPILQYPLLAHIAPLQTLNAIFHLLHNVFAICFFTFYDDTSFTTSRTLQQLSKVIINTLHSV